MGCTSEQSDCDDDEKPAHRVCVDDFYIGRHEVTVKEFKTFIDATNYKTDAEKKGYSYIWTGSNWEKKNGVTWKCDVNGNTRPTSENDHPVIHVSWNDAKAYCKWAGGRLPTEAEWEYAARGGQESKGYKYSGSNNMDEVGWYRGNAGRKTHAVGQKKANELGIYDMSGNVWEWCSDWYDSDYYSSSPERNPQGPANGSLRVYRGGYWFNNARYCRVADRLRDDPDYGDSGLGFRLAHSSN